MKNLITNQKNHYDCVEQSVYQYQSQYTKDFTTNYAYRFFKNNISYNRSKKLIEDLANVLHGNTVGKPLEKGEVVAVIAPMLPEVIASFYAITKNGATFFPIDPRTNATRIRDFLNLAEVKQVLVLDMAYGKLDAIIDETKVENVFVLSVMDSMFLPLAFIHHREQLKKTNAYYKAEKFMNLEDSSKVKDLLNSYQNKDFLTKEDKKWIKNLQIYESTKEIALKNLYYTNPPKSGYINLKDALLLGRKEENFAPVYDEYIPATLTLTSGTTGKPKVVPTKHRSFNVKVRDYSYTTMPIEVGDRMLGMPPFILYGETFMHMAYVRGVQTVVIPDITAYHYPDVIRKEKINHAVGTPSQALTLSEDKHFQKSCPKSLKTVSVGGNKMLIEHERQINKVIAPIKVTQGYSMTELTPSSMTNTPFFVKEGSVGKLLGDTTALVVDLKTMQVLGAGEIGTLLIHSETQFTGYYKNLQATERAFIQVGETTYINTGDRAYFDEDGYYFIQGRDKEMIIRPDGHNNFPSEMDEVIVSHPAIKDCAVVGIPYPNYESPIGEYPRAHVVLREEYYGQEEKIEEVLKKYCLDHLPERDVPYTYRFHETLPLTPNLKPDKEVLKQWDKEEYLREKEKQKKLSFK